MFFANMKIICVGQMKTGTKSLAKALEILGYKVYDFDSQLLHHGDFWFDVLQNCATPDVRSLHEKLEQDIDALIDMPSTFFFEEILEAFPDIKVIQTVRDEVAWLQSIVNQLKMHSQAQSNQFNKILRFISPTKQKIDTMVNSYLYAFLGSTNPNAQTVLRKRYRHHNTNVKAVVPKDKLLVFDVKQGWESLCEFLSCDVPACPFPHQNLKGEISTRAYLMKHHATFVKKIEEEIRQGFKVVFVIMLAVIILVISCLML